MSAVEASLVAVALVSGVTGAWSPCGFSMVDTIGLSGHRGGRLTTFAACATFVPGAIVGGAATFGTLGVLGGLLLGVEARLAYLVAAAIAITAAVLEVRGARIVPQIRRQLPEGWRWRMPLPLAAGLYGVLLGLGFTTFVLTFAVWALAGVSFALGDWQTGLAIGIAFGVGRALPVVLLAPSVDRPWAIRLTEMMAERPGAYRGFRLGDAGALMVAAASLAATAPATASDTPVQSGADPSAWGRALAYQLPNQRAVLSDGARRVYPPGTDPALSSSYLATITGGDEIRILRRPGLTEVGSIAARGVDALAISNAWLVYRVSDGGRDALRARNIRNPADPGAARRLAGISRPAQLGAPSIDGNRIVYALARRRSNAIVKRVLGSRSHAVIVSSRADALSSPSVRGDRLLYVRAHRKRNGPQSTSVPGLRQSLMLKHLGHHGPGRRIYSRGAGGTLWSTSLTDARAYATVLAGRRQRIISVRP